MEKSDYNNLGEIANNLLNEGAKSEAERKAECEKKAGHYWCTKEKKCKLKDSGGWDRGGINEANDPEFAAGLRKEIMNQVDRIEDHELLMKISHYIALRRDEAMTDVERKAREDMDQLDHEKAHDRAGLPPFSSKEPGVDW
tara:strand:- start:1545 stop:1967 length:423 start_codon:yes stop_codon:yes gene_type:complete